MTGTYSHPAGSLDGFAPNQTIYVVEKKVTETGESDGYTYECLTYKSEDDGVRLTYTYGGQAYRVFVPTHMIRRIYQLM